jgi:hypothetical protein
MLTILNALWWTLLRPCKGRGRYRWNAKGRVTMRRLRSWRIPPGTLGRTRATSYASYWCSKAPF